ncbi:hypothetical protein PPL_07491 [Heterostelium album PN500]|uniref:F-box domain-containing protein n=1 Tax=Heterostelium pallidum (strain ATCC 26659 / Pp 5 / PN500) TaxID=670386 RepID=D3BG40_HETP5|nr:hypothetical protein PPL_07491 [Heterostelium album PN500]EFA79632.1 hypothetical protein PPL_07491 [Heterostelium album PN500]|eukprot:XP_020431753.1 hypothetical protein PPL_07491 [Heterostelium album PN500]
MDNTDSILGKRSNQETTTSVKKKQKDEQLIIVEEAIELNDLNSLINFNRIYNLYYQCLESRNDIFRSQCVKFFVDYHRFKYIHYFDVQGYIKFIVDVFFDPEFDVFNNMSSFICRAHIPTIQHIHNRIINDKRKRIEIYHECCYFNKIDSLEYDFNGFYNKLLAKNNQVIHEITVKEQIHHCKIQTGNNININSGSNLVNNESRCILPDILLDRIISFSLVDLTTFNIKQNDVEIVLNIACVSKQFFKMVSKYIPNGYYLRGPINLHSEHCAINSLLDFDYDSIKYIKYGEGTDRINQLFERVKEFTIKSDENDHFFNVYSDDYKRWYMIRQSFSDKEGDTYFYHAIERKDYLVHLPAMPNLKRITVTEYYGYKSNYSSFLTSLITSTPNGDGHGIESFRIDIKKDECDYPEFSNLFFLAPLLRLHSNTLKSIVIRYIESCHDDDMELLLQILTDFIPKLEQHSFSFILYADYGKLERACQDGLDRKISSVLRRAVRLRCLWFLHQQQQS